MYQCLCRSRSHNMALYRMSRIAFLFIFVIIVSDAKHVHKRSLRDVKCNENQRFYRNPDRPEDKMWTFDECSKYYLCLEGDVFEFKCSQGLLFDVNRQLCDTQQNVHNCDLSVETLIPKPLLENASCKNESYLGCADGSCIPADYFCDGSMDCADSSDEGWCDMNQDPNAATPCDEGLCKLPHCFCSTTGTKIPGKLEVTQVPQMITLTFSGSINHENWDLYTRQLFPPERKNPNGCGIRGTFFVSHPYTNYRHVQILWNEGHEIAVNSITNRGPEDWWAKNATIEEWFDEMVGQANIINRFANVRMEDFRGLRVPFLSVGWNRQFLMMNEFGFVYDSTILAPLSPLPYWPYTFDYKMPHSCTAKNQNCPTRSYPSLWEMVINPIKFGDELCSTLSNCTNTHTADEVYGLLINNFKRHYLINRAPFGVHLDSKWLKNHDNLEGFKKFLDEMLKLPEVYFVTNNQAIEWIRHPIPVNKVGKFTPWQCQPEYFEPSEIACSQPNTCKLSSKTLEHDRYMITCNYCPRSYPWLRNEFGFD